MQAVRPYTPPARCVVLAGIVMLLQVVLLSGLLLADHIHGRPASETSFTFGLGIDSQGWVFRRGIRSEPLSSGWLQVPWSAYNQASGETHPAAGDIDGDGLDELVLGLGPGAHAGGWVCILDDPAHQNAVLQWYRLPWQAYNEADGRTYPACGDLDDDGVAELVLGLGPFRRSGGWLHLAAWRRERVQSRGWVRIPWAGYNDSNGETHPSCGNLDQDNALELVVGLGCFPGQGGWLYLLDDATAGHGPLGWTRVGWSAYNQQNGETWPSCGDTDGDGVDELALGLGAGAAGWSPVLGRSADRWATRRWVRLPWGSYNSESGLTRCALGDEDGDGRAELLLGTGPFPGQGGWAKLFDDQLEDFRPLEWIRIPWAEYQRRNGELWPVAANHPRLDPPVQGITGVVQEASNGGPIPGAEVFLVREGESVGSLTDHAARIVGFVETNAQGSFYFCGVAGGDYRLQARGPGKALAESQTITMRPDVVESVVMSLSSEARLSGRVLDRNGAGVEGSLLLLLRGDTGEPVWLDAGEMTSGEQGAFSLGGLPQGTYSLLMYTPQGEMGRVTGIGLTRGVESMRDVRLENSLDATAILELFRLYGRSLLEGE